MRLALATCIIYWHTRGMVPGIAWTDRTVLLANICRLALPMFFALSGFLVASSLERLNKLMPFLAMRILRLLPALAVEVTMSALILGPLVTTLPLAEYFSHPDFWKYFLNIVGDVQLSLPGVFKSSPTKVVNASLWTLPFELKCYIYLAGLFLIGAFHRTRYLVAIFLIGTAWSIWREPLFSWLTSPIPPGRLLVLDFIAGAIVFKIREWLPGGLVPAALAAALSLGLVQTDITTWLSPLLLAYATAAIGCLAIPRAPIILDGDYSYGLYLYAYPIQQTWAQILHSDSLSVNFLISFVTVFIFAAFSWHLIERPVLALKSRFSSPELPKIKDAPWRVSTPLR